MVTHSVTMLEKHLVFAGETPPRNFTTNRVKKRSIKPEDPMSHRIIEKRRRDRMNNCLADLSRLIPPEYLKKGRGRIEKTEIIEMAIKHMRHLQNIIASSRFNENSDNSVPSPPATAASREGVTFTGDQPIVIEHYRLGYLECLSEAMHFLVEVQGYFAGDSLCVQMINHLHKHCDKILKGNTLNFPKKHIGEGPSSESSASPANGAFNSSPPLGMSNSTGSTSDDNQPNHSLEPGKQFEVCPKGPQQGLRSPRRYSDGSFAKNPEVPFGRFGDREGVDSETRSDSEPQQNFGLKFKKDSSKSYLNNFETGSNFGPRNYPIFNGIYVEDSVGFETISLKEENENGPSQLREMLTSPSSNQTGGHLNKTANETKGNTSPASNTSCCDSLPSLPLNVKSSPTPKTYKEPADGSGEFSEVAPDNQHMMYKFKNNIKQRFSKEKRENPECEFYGDAVVKKPKPSEDFLKHSDPLMRERLNLLDRMEAEEEKMFKFNADLESKRRIRYASESEIHDGDILNRLSFGHKSSEKGKRWEEAEGSFPYQSNPKLWGLSSTGPVPFFSSQTPLGGKAGERQAAEYNSSLHNSFNNISKGSSEPGPGIPIFALHAKGSFYIPLTLDHATLSPFLTILGVTKSDEGVDDKTVLHPVTISVNFQSHLVR